MLIPARRLFSVSRFFSNRFNTELTRPAPWPLLVAGNTNKAEVMKATSRPADINLFILAPYSKRSFPSARKKPRNYRERSSYVNLQAARAPLGVHHFSNS